MGLLYFLFAPRWYQSTVAVVPNAPPKTSGIPAGLATALTGGIDLGFDLGLTADVERIAAVFQSASVTDAAIEKFRLMERYDSRYIEMTRKEVWSHCAVSYRP